MINLETANKQSQLRSQIRRPNLFRIAAAAEQSPQQHPADYHYENNDEHSRHAVL
jgi:hypothetical protein